MPILAGQVEINLPSVFFVPWWGFFKGLLCIDPSCWETCSLEVIEGLFKEPFLDSVLVFHPSGGFHHQVDDSPKYCGVKVWVPLDDVSC